MRTAVSNAMASAPIEDSRQLLRQLSHQHSDSGDDVVAEELDLLSNVYFEELEIAHPKSGTVLNFHIAPSTAEDKEKQFVYLDLSITLTAKYPNSRPDIQFIKSRGLSDAHLRGIDEGLRHKSLEYLGSPMVYQLVEYARECLTDNNRPCGECAICRCGFEETDEFTKTECYHYFHLPCLARYIEFQERQQLETIESDIATDPMLRKKLKQLECPVCREPIAPDATCLAARDQYDVGTEETTTFVPSHSLKSWQQEMASLLGKQRERGGTISLAGDDDVIDDTWVSTPRVREMVESTASCGPKERKTKVRQQAIVPSSKSKRTEKESLANPRSKNEAQSLTGNGVKVKVLSENKQRNVRPPPGFEHKFPSASVGPDSPYGDTASAQVPQKGVPNHLPSGSQQICSHPNSSRGRQREWQRRDQPPRYRDDHYHKSKHPASRDWKKPSQRDEGYYERQRKVPVDHESESLSKRKTADSSCNDHPTKRPNSHDTVAARQHQNQTTSPPGLPLQGEKKPSRSDGSDSRRPHSSRGRPRDRGYGGRERRSCKRGEGTGTQEGSASEH